VLDTVRKDLQAKFILVLFVLLTIWWLAINVFNIHSQFQSYFFAAIYGLVALLGGIWGIFISRHWGGTKSILGRAIIFFSLGLLMQEFGQIIFSYYNIFLHIEVPYPSLADLGFFGTIPFYILGITLLAKASGVKIALRSLTSKIQAIIIPTVILIIGYLLFLQGYTINLSNPIKVFLDFAYPLGDALYVSLAVLTYLLSRTILGGTMKKRILFILFALTVQFITDYNFLFQSSRGTWVNGGYGDYLYLLAYFLMAMGLLQLKTVLDLIKTGPAK
jgi:hypothetical protein